MSFKGTKDELMAVMAAMYARVGTWRRVNGVVLDILTSLADKVAVEDRGKPLPDLPYKLTAEQREHVCKAIRLMLDKPMSWETVVERIGYPRDYIEAFLDGSLPGSTILAIAVAHAKWLDIEDLLDGQVGL